MYMSQLMSPLLHRSLLLVGAALAMGCDSISTQRDASAPTTERMAEVLVRIDAPGGGAPAVSVLAFRASVTGPLTSDVLEMIDPLVAGAPERCELRDVATAARKLWAQGGTIDLEELPNVSLALGPDSSLKPLPRVYPQLASAVGGVIGEAGPVDLNIAPTSIGVALPGEEPVPLAVRGIPRLVDASGEALAAGTRLDPAHDLQLTVSGPAGSFLEIRPFGASRFITCPAGAAGRVVVPHDLVQKLIATGSHGTVSFEAVWRDSRSVAGGHATRLSIEARSSAVLDLRGPVAQPSEAARPSAPPAP
jgi:hypothetical protein